MVCCCVSGLDEARQDFVAFGSCLELKLNSQLGCMFCEVYFYFQMCENWSFVSNWVREGEL